MWEYIRRLRERTAVTILLTTHYLDEADALADRILVMDDGRLVADDSPAALKARVAGDVIHLAYADPVRLMEARAVARDGVAVRDVAAEGQELTVTVEDGTVAIAPLLGALEAAGQRPDAVSIRRPTLNDVFLTLTGHSLREDEPIAAGARS